MARTNLDPIHLMALIEAPVITWLVGTVASWISVACGFAMGVWYERRMAKRRARARAVGQFQDEMEAVARKRYNAKTTNSCRCEHCLDELEVPPMERGMVLCSICGNKRCPHAAHHDNACTNSNEIGQKGSSYELCKECLSTPGAPYYEPCPIHRSRSRKTT